MNVRQLIESDLTFQEAIGPELKKIWNAARGGYEAPAAPPAGAGPAAAAQAATRGTGPRFGAGPFGKAAGALAGMAGYAASKISPIFKSQSPHMAGRAQAQSDLELEAGGNFIQVPPEDFAKEIDEYIKNFAAKVRPAFSWADKLWASGENETGGKLGFPNIKPNRWGARSPHLSLTLDSAVATGTVDATGKQNTTNDPFRAADPAALDGVISSLSSVMDAARKAKLPGALDGAINELKGLFDFLHATFGDVLPDVRSIESRLAFAVNQWPLMDREYQEIQAAKDSPEDLRRVVEKFMLRLSAISSSIRSGGDELTFWAESAEDTLIDATRRGRNRVVVPKEFWDRLLSNSSMLPKGVATEPGMPMPGRPGGPAKTVFQGPEYAQDQF